MITVQDVRKNPVVVAYLNAANEHMKALGYTEHGERHASLVSSIAHNILERINFEHPYPELAAIAGYLHDIGNMISRGGHEQTGALMAMGILREMGMEENYISIVAGAIGDHEEPTGLPVNPVAAAVILADKADVHRSRVHNPNLAAFDIHDRVNYASQKSFLRVDSQKKTITLEITIDTDISQVMEYFEIFLDRMMSSRKAAEFLGYRFELIINKTRLF